MIAENGTSHEEGSFELDESRHPTERGYYGQAFRQGLVRKPPPGAPRTVNISLWVLNVVIGLLLTAFVVWRLYAVYIVGET